MGTNLFDLVLGKEKNALNNDVQGKHPEVVLNERLFEQYRSSRRLWEAEAKEDEDFRNGAQWTETQKKALERKGQSPIVVNVIQPAVEQAKALLTFNSPQFSSTAREDSDTKTAKVFADSMKYIWQNSDGNAELKQAIDDYYVRGLGAMLAYVDPHADFGKGEIFVKNLDSFDLYIDPNCKRKDLSDAAHVIISKILTGEQIQDMIPEARNLLDKAIQEDDDGVTTDRTGIEGQADVVQDQYHQKYRIIDRYSKIKVGKYHVYEPTGLFEEIFDAKEYEAFLKAPAVTLASPQGIQYVLDPKEVQRFVGLYKETNGVIDEQTTFEFHTVEELIARGVVIVNRFMIDRVKRVMSFGGVLLFNGVMPISSYPIFPFMNRHNRNPYPMSDVRFVRGLQEYINKIRSLIIAHASSSTNVKLLLPRGATNKKQIEDEWARAGTAVIEFDAEIGTPIVAGPVPLPNELYRNEDEAKKDIQEILGIYMLGQGDASQAHSSYRGTVAIDEFGQRRIKSKRDDIESTLNIMGKVIVEMIQAYWKEPKILRIVQPNSLEVEQRLNYPIYDDLQNVVGKMNDVTVGKYDIVVVSGSTLPSSRWGVLDHYKELFQMGIIDQVEVLKKTEVADIEGVLARAGEITQLRQQLEQAMEAIKNLEGDQQTLQRENIHLNKRVEVEKFKTDLKSTGGDLKKAQQLYEERLNDNIKIDRLERKAKNNGKDNQ